MRLLQLLVVALSALFKSGVKNIPENAEKSMFSGCEEVYLHIQKKDLIQSIFPGQK